MTHFVPKLFISVLSFAMLLCFSSAQSLKVGIVDMNRVFAEYYKTKDADKVVNEQKEAAKKELESINNDYKKLLDSYQNLAKELKDPAIGEALRKKKTEEAQQVASKARALEREKKSSQTDDKECCLLRLIEREKLSLRKFKMLSLTWLRRKTMMWFLINQA